MKKYELPKGLLFQKLKHLPIIYVQPYDDNINIFPKVSEIPCTETPPIENFYRHRIQGVGDENAFRETMKSAPFPSFGGYDERGDFILYTMTDEHMLLILQEYNRRITRVSIP